jgi:hypothetical protein
MDILNDSGPLEAIPGLRRHDHLRGVTLFYLGTRLQAADVQPLKT